MNSNYPHLSLDLLVINDNKILLGLLTKNWLYEGQQVYGVPGREIQFQETMGDAIKRDIKTELGCKVTNYEIISVNANYAFDNHFVGIGAVVSIEGDVQNLHPNDWEKWEWFSLEEIPENLFPPAKNLIESYKQKKITVSE